MSNRDYNYWISALAWTESVSPKIMLRVFIFVFISIITTFLCGTFSALNWAVGPLEISGVALGLLLVIRTNSGYDRWWEARKLWGGIVNQSRNLAIAGINFGVQDSDWQNQFCKLVTEFPFKVTQVLRMEVATNTAVAVSNEIASLVGQGFRSGQIRSFEFNAIEQQRALLIDHLGGCERILKTPLPRILEIKVRRFLSLSLLLVPLGLAHKMGWYTPLIMFLLSYTLLALDQIGVELQNPFMRNHLSALPIDEISAGIKSVIESLTPEGQWIPNSNYKLLIKE